MVGFRAEWTYRTRRPEQLSFLSEIQTSPLASCSRFSDLSPSPPTSNAVSIASGLNGGIYTSLPSIYNFRHCLVDYQKNLKSWSDGPPIEMI